MQVDFVTVSAAARDALHDAVIVVRSDADPAGLDECTAQANKAFAARSVGLGRAEPSLIPS